MNTKLVTFITAVFVICASTYAAQLNGRWEGNSLTFRRSTVSFPTGSSWTNAYQDAINKFNRNPSRFQLGLAADSGGVGRNNGQSETWFSSDSNALSNAPAVCWTWYRFDIWDWKWYIREADVIFDVNHPYTTSTYKPNLWPYYGAYRGFQGTVLHEVGHGAGLGHTGNTYSIMGKEFEHLSTNSNTARAYFGEDACDGLVDLYGNQGTRQDLGVVHFKFNAPGEYSDHIITRMYNSAGSPLSYSWLQVGSGWEKRYNVNRNQTVKAEFSYENNGASYQSSIPIGFYISTNSYISTYDRRIGTSSYNLARNVVYTTKRTLTIPSNLTVGRTYYLGVIIDYTGSRSEVDESNNATYLPIRIQN